MNKELKLKYSRIKEHIAAMGEVVVAYSGGVDSTLLLKICKDVLHEKAYALTGVSHTMTQEDRTQALKQAEAIGVTPVLIETKEFESTEFCSNPMDRCYHCKKKIFVGFLEYMSDNNLRNLLDGSNTDDLKDFRPGKKALEELRVISPFIDTGFTKSDIRELSKELNLSTWNKEALACLATRIAYGEEITQKKLKCIAKAEKFLRDKGFTYVRTRIQGDQMRIETLSEELPLLFTDGMRQEVVAYMKNIGFKYITIDMEGYRMGSMNA